MRVNGIGYTDRTAMHELIEAQSSKERSESAKNKKTQYTHITSDEVKTKQKEARIKKILKYLHDLRTDCCC